MWQPSVSVVMCTYNGAQFIKEQMDSILAQTYPVHEFLIFDDGSTDATVAIVESYCARHPYIKFHQNETNLGYNLNFQQALLSVTSEVIAIADQDDYWHPQKIEKMIAAWHKEMPLIHCDSQRFEGDIPEKPYSKRLYTRFWGTDSRKLFFFNSISGHALLVQRSFLPLVLPLEKGIYYDWWMSFVASCNGGVDFLNETLVYQRVHHANVSIDKVTSEKEKFIRYRKEIQWHMKKFLTAPNIRPEDKKLGGLFYQRLSNLNSFWDKLRLLFLMVRYRKTIFYYKKRVVGIFSHLKHAYYWAFN